MLGDHAASGSEAELAAPEGVLEPKRTAAWICGFSAAALGGWTFSSRLRAREPRWLPGGFAQLEGRSCFPSCVPRPSEPVQVANPRAAAGVLAGLVAAELPRG